MAQRNDQDRSRNQNQSQERDRNSPRQQQQFDSGTRQAGGGGQSGSFAAQIREHMEVVDADDARIGTVDHLDGDRIKLTRDASGEHRYLPLSQVAGIEGDRVRLRDRGDATFGMEADR